MTHHTISVRSLMKLHLGEFPIDLIIPLPMYSGTLLFGSITLYSHTERINKQESWICFHSQEEFLMEKTRRKESTFSG